jgi:hypothetical protein
MKKGNERGLENPEMQINRILNILISKWDCMETENNSITHREILQERQF